MSRYLVTLDNGRSYETSDTDAGFDGNTYLGSSNLYFILPGYSRGDYRPYIYAGTDAVSVDSYNEEYHRIVDVELISGGLPFALVNFIAAVCVIIASVKVVLSRR